METRKKTGYGLVARLMAYWVPPVLWMAMIFFLSSRHSVTVSPEYLWNFLFFKTLHLIEYATLFTLFSRAVYEQGRVRVSRSYLAAFVLTMIYAATDEIHQLSVPSRTGQPRDVIIDAIGALLAWYFLSRLLPILPKRLRNLGRHMHIPF